MNTSTESVHVALDEKALERESENIVDLVAGKGSAATGVSRQSALAAAGTLLIASCGGGGESGNSSGIGGVGSTSAGALGSTSAASVGGPTDAPPSQSNPDPAPGAYAFKAPASANEAARFLAQATLGANADDIRMMQTQSYSEWVEGQFNTAPIGGYYDWCAGPDGSIANSGMGEHSSIDNIWRKIIVSPDALRQRMIHALSEIFVVFYTDGPGVLCYMDYMDRLEQNAFGNFRTLIERLTLTKAMGTTLTFINNSKANSALGSQPDENYAREIMQLFTIGLYQLNIDGSLKFDSNNQPLPTYDIPDVQGLARVFTGWVENRGSLPSDRLPTDDQKRDLTQKASFYESGEKRFLGAVVPAGTDAYASLKIALDTLFNHPNVPPFFAKQIIQRLVTSNPSPFYVSRVSRAFIDNGLGVRGDLKAVLRAVLLDDEARNPANVTNRTFGKLREPMFRFSNWARGWNARSPTGWWNFAPGYTSEPSKFNQGPLQSPSVFNFFRPGYSPPTTQVSALGMVAPEFQITNETSIAGIVNIMVVFIKNDYLYDIRADYASLLALAPDSQALLAEINLVLAAGQISPGTVAKMEAALNTIPVNSDAGKMRRVVTALIFAISCPEYVVQK